MKKIDVALEAATALLADPLLFLPGVLLVHKFCDYS